MTMSASQSGGRDIPRKGYAQILERFEKIALARSLSRQLAPTEHLSKKKKLKRKL